MSIMICENVEYITAILTEISMFKKYQAKTIFLISGHRNMTISKVTLITIVSTDRTHDVLFINEYNIKISCNLKVVKSYLG